MSNSTKSTLVGRSATDLAALVRGGEVTAVEVVTAHLARTEELDPQLGAFQMIMAAQALEEARRLQQRSDLKDLPLAGVPVAIKDNVDVAGAPTRMGSAATSGEPAAKDDELVRRLRAAGAIVIGKTRMPELAIWPLTEPQAYGPARNPWKRERSTGGSSGGSAAAVAAGMAPLALGSDGGGSIRVPAACCGIIGLKPTPGLVPLAGGQSDHWLGLTAFGPLTNTVADAAAMLRVLTGATDAGEARRTPERLRVAFSTRHSSPGVKIGSETAAAVRATAKALADAGHDVQEADPPYPSDIGLRFMRRWLPGIAEDARDLPEARLEARSRKMARVGRFVQRRGWAAEAAADPFRAKAQSWIEGFDVLVTATLAEPAVPIGKWDRKGWLATTMGVANWILTPPWNLAGLPAASIPAGLSSDGLPIGVQLVAPVRKEALILDLMEYLEGVRPWTRFDDPGVG
jgi:amidase